MVGIVVIAASAGGLGPLRSIIAALPAPCTAAVFVVVHIGSNPSILPCLLGHAGPLPAAFAHDGDAIEAGRIYVAPPDRHMVLEFASIRLSHGPKVHYTRPQPTLYSSPPPKLTGSGSWALF
jgi:two-component system chemotaxis response regulator CheB